MWSSFSRSSRSLDTDRFRRSIIGLLLVAAFLGAWLAWFLRARVARFEVTDTARLEVDRAIHLVQSPVDGRVVSSRLALDREVQDGELLIELEANSERLQYGEEESRLRVLAPQIEALQSETVAVAERRVRQQAATRTALDEARSRLREADALARLAEGESKRGSLLLADGLISKREFEQGRGEAERRRAAADGLQFAVTRLEDEQRTRDSEIEAQLTRLRGDIARLKGQRDTSAATIERLKYEIRRRRITSPVAGRLGEVKILRAGAVVKEGETLCAVVPSGTLRVIAEFLPPAAVGRIRPGQPAHLRLAGFPWAQYGSISAVVSSVGSEVRDGHVRVELTVKADAPTPIPMQHGLPGSVEVQVERVSPATLVLRAAGRLIAAPAPSTGTTSP